MHDAHILVVDDQKDALAMIVRVLRVNQLEQKLVAKRRD